jgi:transcriptional regulator with XRE-family HTH domain/quercetin dioxygenase-like cupin family protein
MTLESPSTDDRAALPDLGERIRTRRAELSLSVRELARRVAVSPSLISQIERGKATPSVATLYAITSELKLSLDELFAAPRADDGPAVDAPDAPGGLRVLDAAIAEAAGHRSQDGLVVAPADRTVIQLGSGVRWERLTAAADPGVDFLYVVYEPGGASCEPGALMRHSGREYGHILSGVLEVTVGFEDHVLHPGDSISFESSMPHRLATVGDEPVEALWFVVGRSGDLRNSS